jgi:hypothetical protein
MSDIKSIINEELQNFFEDEVSTANFPSFGDHLRSIDETGEGTAEPYNYKFEDISFFEVNYNFDTEDGDEYVVYIVKRDESKRVWEMAFGAVGYDSNAVVNKGRLFRIMATVLRITNDFIDRFTPNILKIKPSKNRGENDMRRFNMYMQYIKKNLRPDYFARELQPYIIIERKIKK